jgi:predicted O-methyltransferase YrrM
MGTAWLLVGMDRESSLISVEREERLIEVARKYLGGDARVTFRHEDAATLIGTLPTNSFDLIFADTWAGKYTHLTEALELLKPGGIYVIDDMLPQSTWPEGHPPKVERLIAELESRCDLTMTKLDWASGIIIAVKKSSD